MIETNSRTAHPPSRIPRRASRSSLTLLDRPSRRPQPETPHGSGIVTVPRVVMPVDRGPKTQEQPRKRGLAHGRPQREGVVIGIGTLLGCAGAICAFGVFYLATYAKVASEERQINALQQEVFIAQAHHQMLVQDLARLQNAKRIDKLASQMRMVQVQTSDYIGNDAPASNYAESSAQMASAR